MMYMKIAARKITGFAGLVAAGGDMEPGLRQGYIRSMGDFSRGANYGSRTGNR